MRSRRGRERRSGGSSRSERGTTRRKFSCSSAVQKPINVLDASRQRMVGSDERCLGIGGTTLYCAEDGAATEGLT